MTETIGYERIAGMVQGGVDSIRANHEHLSKLDSVIGDGDHGSAMLRSMEAAEKALHKAEGRDPRKMLYDVGWGMMSASGGAGGPLVGALFMGLSQGMGDAAELDAAGLAAAFEAGLAGVREESQAQPGDKTMMDALIPAVEALRAAAEAGAGVVEAMDRAAQAAAAGAEGTRAMRARFGKARSLGERTIGHPDPGATSVALLFRGFVEGIQRNG